MGRTFFLMAQLGFGEEWCFWEGKRKAVRLPEKQPRYVAVLWQNKR